jgi:hypothetical protein
MLHSIANGDIRSFSIEKSFWKSFFWLTLRSEPLAPVDVIKNYLLKFVSLSVLADMGFAEKNIYQVINNQFRVKVERPHSRLKSLLNNCAVLSEIKG